MIVRDATDVLEQLAWPLTPALDDEQLLAFADGLAGEAAKPQVRG